MSEKPMMSEKLMLNKAVRLIRVYHDMSQLEVAERLGLSKSFVSELENGRKRVSIETLEKYAHAFDIPMSSLMLFAERTGASPIRNDAREFIADKTLKMLDWISTISGKSAA